MSSPYHSIFLQAGCSSLRPTNSVKALKAQYESVQITAFTACCLKSVPIVLSHWSDLVFTVLEVKFLLKYMYSALTKSETVHVFLPKP